MQHDYANISIGAIDLENGSNSSQSPDSQAMVYQKFKREKYDEIRKGEHSLSKIKEK